MPPLGQQRCSSSGVCLGGGGGNRWRRALWPCREDALDDGPHPARSGLPGESGGVGGSPAAEVIPQGRVVREALQRYGDGGFVL